MIFSTIPTKPDGDVLSGNIYKDSIMDILDGYMGKRNEQL